MAGNEWIVSIENVINSFKELRYSEQVEAHYILSM